MTPEARAAAYALAERLWGEPDQAFVAVSIHDTGSVQVSVHFRPHVSGDRAEEVLASLDARDVSHSHLTQEPPIAWAIGSVTWDGHEVQVVVHHQPDTTEEGPR